MIPPSKLSLPSTEWVWVGFFLCLFCFLFFLASLLTLYRFVMIVNCSFRKAVKVAQARSSPPCSCLCWAALTTVPMGALCHHAWLPFVKASFGWLFSTFLLPFAYRVDLLGLAFCLGNVLRRPCSFRKVFVLCFSRKLPLWRSSGWLCITWRVSYAAPSHSLSNQQRGAGSARSSRERAGSYWLTWLWS